jgi:hypothetical protein
MGDGGFWHNGLTSGIGNAVFNRHDAVTVIVDNGYSAATGGQDILSSRAPPRERDANQSIMKAVTGIGVKWVKRVHTYDMRETLAVLREALTTQYTGANARSTVGAVCGRSLKKRSPTASVWCASALASMLPCAPAITHAYAYPGAHPLPSKKIPIRYARILSHMLITHVSVAACAVRLRMPRCCARRSTAPTLSTTPRSGIGSCMPRAPPSSARCKGASSESACASRCE